VFYRHEIEMKYQEIMKNAGILNIDGVKRRVEISELESLGELGHGTCGHVVRMRHKETGTCMAVKVRTILFFAVSCI
jgi:mitogen-activated protein kinase kinase 7